LIIDSVKDVLEESHVDCHSLGHALTEILESGADPRRKLLELEGLLGGDYA
jgi:hypothetical protein